MSKTDVNRRDFMKLGLAGAAVSALPKRIGLQVLFKAQFVATTST